MKKQLDGQGFATENDLIAAWDKACPDLPQEKWDQIANDWFLRMQNCIDRGGGYFEKVWKSLKNRAESQDLSSDLQIQNVYKCVLYLLYLLL